MPTRPPPSRYRVTERGRRLEVVDTWTASRPRRMVVEEAAPAEAPDAWSADPVPADPIVDDAAEVAPAVPRSAPAPLDLLESAASRDRSVLDPLPAPTPSMPSMIAEQPDFLRTVAATVCSDARDGDGRLLLRTARFYDRKGPRAIALDVDGERELGLAMLVALAFSVGAVLFAVSFGWSGIVLAVIAVGFARQIGLAATPWLDRLAGRTR